MNSDRGTLEDNWERNIIHSILWKGIELPGQEAIWVSYRDSHLDRTTGFCNYLRTGGRKVLV
jgi:hypothetical protein